MRPTKRIRFRPACPATRKRPIPMQTGETSLTVKITRAAAGRTKVTVVTRRRRGPLVPIHGRDESTCSTAGPPPDGVLDRAEPPREAEPPPEVEPGEPPDDELTLGEEPPAAAVVARDSGVTATGWVLAAGTVVGAAGFGAGGSVTGAVG